MCSDNIDLGRSLPVPQIMSRHWSSKANKKRQINSGMQKKIDLFNRTYRHTGKRDKKNAENPEIHLQGSKQREDQDVSKQSQSRYGPNHLGPILFMFQFHTVMVWHVVRIAWNLSQEDKSPSDWYLPPNMRLLGKFPFLWSPLFFL